MDKYEALEFLKSNGGILRLIPTFVPRPFSVAGKRLRLHPDDYYAYGTKRGAIKERWFSSVISSNNGALMTENEGMSYVSLSDNEKDKVLLKEMVDLLGKELIGDELFNKHHNWPMYSKFFDYNVPLFHHLHLGFEDAKKVGKLGKPEAYYFPRQYNPHVGEFPATYFGFDPDCTKEEVKERLKDFLIKDNRITELSRAYRIELGTGWYTPPGVIHAPGSCLTYEPQWNSDINSVYENIATGEVYDKNFLTENMPENEQDDLDAVIDLLDWDKNVDPHYKKTFHRKPVLQSEEEGVYTQTWIVYDTNYISAKELTVMPMQTVIIKDEGAYGCILTQGFGKIGTYHCETAGMLRFGQLSADEFFVSHDSAIKGVEITNLSQHEPLVILKHFGMDKVELEKK